MADYIDNNSCHIDQTAAATVAVADVIDEVDILSTYTTLQDHQNDEIIISSSFEVSAWTPEHRASLNKLFLVFIIILFLCAPSAHAWAMRYCTL